MFDQDFKKSSRCFSEEELVSYLYNEIDDSERARLDDHLSDCITCTDEFASLSEPRFSVYRWQKTEFADLATPVIFGPWEEAPVPEVNAVESSSASWIHALLAAFRRPAFAFTAVPIVILISFTVGLYVKYVPNAKDDVATTNPETVVQAPSEPAAGSTIVPLPRVEKKRMVETHLAANENTKAKNSTQYAKAVKSSAPRQLMKNEVASTNTPNKPVSYRRAPRLSDFEEEEDNSVRLADLLAESDRDRDK